MKEKICQNCRYYDNGYCKKYPPKQFIITSITSDGEYFFHTEYPFVCKSDWCGEWEKNNRKE